jgi:class 3 adenylate cyclase
VPRLQAKSFAIPDDVRASPLLRVETVAFDDIRVGHCRFQPGWRWSTDVGPQVGTSSCFIRHVGYSISGQVHVEMADGQALDIGPNMVFEIPPDHDKWVVGDEPWITIEWGGSGRAMEAALKETGSRTIATILFTDIVGSTATLQRVGDAAWDDLLGAHNARLREELNVYRGREIKTTGDGLLAVFDSPTRAVRCAAALVATARSTDLPIRVGVHTGEVELVGSDVRGLAVHAAARLVGLAGANEVLVSATTRDLLDGSNLVLEDAGTHELKGLRGARQVYRLAVDASA